MKQTAPPEPTPLALAGDTPGRVAKRLFLATRPGFLTASVLPVIAGTAWGYRVAGRLDMTAAVLALLATVCVHAASNVLNDVGDELGGSDRANPGRIYPYTGGSRFIQNEVMSVQGMTRWGLALLGAAVVFGTALIAHAGLAVLVFGLTGVLLGLAYSLPPLQLCARGVGEATVAIAFGVLPVSGAAWLQSSVLDLRLLLVSVPVSCWVAAILLINEVPDIAADGAVGKRTLPVRLGLQGTRWVYLGLHATAFAAVAALGLSGLLHVAAIALPALLLLAAWSGSRGIVEPGESRARLVQGIRTTLAVHAAGSLWLAASIVFSAQ